MEGGSDRTELDLGADARLFPVEQRQPAPALGRFSRLRQDEFDLDADAYRELACRVNAWRERVADR